MSAESPDSYESSSPRAGTQTGQAASLLRQRFYKQKDAAIDSAMGKSETWARSIAHGRAGVLLDDIARLLHFLGLKIVDENKCVVDRDVYEAYKTLAKHSLNTPTQADWMKGDGQ